MSLLFFLTLILFIVLILVVLLIDMESISREYIYIMAAAVGGGMIGTINSLTGKLKKKDEISIKELSELKEILIQ